MCEVKLLYINIASNIVYRSEGLLVVSRILYNNAFFSYLDILKMVVAPSFLLKRLLIRNIAYMYYVMLIWNVYGTALLATHPCLLF